MLNLSQTSHGIVKNVQYCWLYLAFCTWLKRVCVIEPGSVDRLHELIFQAYPFFVFVMGDGLVADHRRHIDLVRMSTR